MARDRAAREEAKPLRLFVAADPPPTTLALVNQHTEAWRERLGAGRWVPPENRHVTVTFLGRVWPRLRGWVGERLTEATSRVRPFESGLTSFGVFPGRSRARVLWVGLDDRSGGWQALAREVSEALADEFEPEKRAFTPHLTVARFDPPIPFRDHQEALDEPLDTPRFRVGQIVLYRSHLQRPAPRYEPLERFPLLG
jgi:2'-5' RNA ligase